MTHVTRINTAAFERLATFLEDHPDNYDQSHWLDIEQDDEKPLCGSTGCLAGWLCVTETEDFEQIGLAFYPTSETIVREYGVDVDDGVGAPGRRLDRIANQFDDWTSAYWFRTASEVLNLSHDEAEHLFHGNGRPADGLTVSEAMHKIAMGASIWDVWSVPSLDD